MRDETAQAYRASRCKKNDIYLIIFVANDLTTDEYAKRNLNSHVELGTPHWRRNNVECTSVVKKAFHSRSSGKCSGREHDILAHQQAKGAKCRRVSLDENT